MSPSARTTPRRRSAVPWLYAVSALLCLLAPVLFLAFWVADPTMAGLGAALLAAVIDLVAAAVAAAVATVLAARRGVARVRTVVLGHPEGREGRLAEHRSARWQLARERFAALQRDYAAFESDPRAVAQRPALVDVTVTTTARFVEALADAQYLATPTEPTGPRREEFAAAVDRAVDAWADARRTADALASSSGPAAEARLGQADAPHAATAAPPPLPPTRAPRAPAGTDAHTGSGAEDEYAAVADAVRRAAARGVRDLRGRLRA